MQKQPPIRRPDLHLDETHAELDWLKKKLQIKTNLAKGRQRTVKRGEVFGCEFGYNIGSELRDYHPCVILQSDSFSLNGWTVFVAPITHASSRIGRSPFLIPIAQQVVNGQILVEGNVDLAGVRSVSKARLTRCVATLPPDEMKKVDEVIAGSFHLYHYHADCEKKLEKAQKRGDDAAEKIKKLRAALATVDSMITEGEEAEIKRLISDALAL